MFKCKHFFKHLKLNTTIGQLDLFLPLRMGNEIQCFPTCLAYDITAENIFNICTEKTEKTLCCNKFCDL